MSEAQRGLGRGLDALLKGIAEPPKENEIAMIALDSIVPNPHQPRKDFPEETLLELSESIKSQGVLQPILVRPRPSDGAKRYELIAGERRLRASRMAGKKTIPCIVRTISDDESLIITIIENLQREDLNVIDAALGLQQLRDRLELSQESLAQQVGMSRPAVANTLRLLQLPQEIQSDLRSSVLSAGHARTLLSISTPVHQIELRDRIVAHDLTVRQSEKIANFWRQNKVLPPLEVENVPSGKRKYEKNSAAKSPLLLDVQGKIAESIQIKVTLKGSTNKGQLTLFYESEEDFQRLLATFGVSNAH